MPPFRRESRAGWWDLRTRRVPSRPGLADRRTQEPSVKAMRTAAERYSTVPGVVVWRAR
jgi:hypothetical protein